MSQSGRKLSVTKTSKSTTAFGKSLCQQPTHSCHRLSITVRPITYEKPSVKSGESIGTYSNNRTVNYITESHRLSSMTRSRDEIKRQADQLDDNEVGMKLQTEIRRLVVRIVLHMKIQKFIIYYHTPKWLFNSNQESLNCL